MTPFKIAASVCLAAAIFAAGYLANRPAAPAAAVRSVLYYSCPMHPQYRSDRPGDCPSCGMRLVAVNTAESSAPGSITISDAEQRLIGVKTVEVRREAVSQPLRVPGRVAVDDSRLYRLVAAADGWVRELGDNPAGTFVKKDQVLAKYYVRDMLSAQQNYLYAYQVSAQTQQAQANTVPQRGTVGFNLRLALDGLRSIGMTDAQIAELEQTKEATSTLGVYAPAEGFVLARNISPGQRFDKGTELYRIADIGHVWVLADIFEKDRDFLKPNVMAIVRYRGRELHARLSDALPQFDPQSRTLKTRFELDNAGYTLRPDMFVDVEVQVVMPATITVPAEAVIDSGRRKTVYVARGGGMFEPRLVSTGWRLGDSVQVTQGLQPGENIVVSGNFLIDSESRMKQIPAAPSAEPTMAAMAKTSTMTTAAVKDPVCGMGVDPKASTTLKKEYGGNTYYFCSDNCRRSFEANPGKYVPGKMSAQEKDGMRGPA